MKTTKVKSDKTPKTSFFLENPYIERLIKPKITITIKMIITSISNPIMFLLFKHIIIN